MIQEALLSLIRDRTVLIIAPGMRTIANANKVVVLKDGVIAEQGDCFYNWMQIKALVANSRLIS